MTKANNICRSFFFLYTTLYFSFSLQKNIQFFVLKKFNFFPSKRKTKQFIMRVKKSKERTIKKNNFVKKKNQFKVINCLAILGDAC